MGPGRRQSQRERLTPWRPAARHVPYSIYWQNLSGGDGGNRQALGDAITAHFVSFEAFAGQPTGDNQRPGIGLWVLSYEPLSLRLIIARVYDHHGNVWQGAIPLLVFDAWEHAYYLPSMRCRRPVPLQYVAGCLTCEFMEWFMGLGSSR